MKLKFQTVICQVSHPDIPAVFHHSLFSPIKTFPANIIISFYFTLLHPNLYSHIDLYCIINCMRYNILMTGVIYVVEYLIVPF